MHEMSLAESILRIVEDAAHSRGFRRVKVLRLEIGALAGVEAEALRFCLDVILRDGVAAGARVEIERLPGQGWCMQCGDTVPIAALFDTCPRCGGCEVQATGGTEMRVKDLLVE